MRIDLFIHTDVDKKTDEILRLLRTIIEKENHMSLEIDALTAQVTENTDTEASAVQLLQNLHDLLVAAGTDPTKLADLATTLKTSRDALAASITANTPAA